MALLQIRIRFNFFFKLVSNFCKKFQWGPSHEISQPAVTFGEIFLKMTEIPFGFILMPIDFSNDFFSLSSLRMTSPAFSTGNFSGIVAVSALFSVSVIILQRHAPSLQLLLSTPIYNTADIKQRTKERNLCSSHQNRMGFHHQISSP